MNTEHISNVSNTKDKNRSIQVIIENDKQIRPRLLIQSCYQYCPCFIQSDKGLLLRYRGFVIEILLPKEANSNAIGEYGDIYFSTFK